MFRKVITDPKQLSFDELLAIKLKVDAEIAERRAAEIETLKTKVTAIASALGQPIAELLGLKSEPVERRGKRSPRVKFRDPDNPANVWTGRGRLPKWLQERIEKGAAKEQFQVQ